MHISHAHDIKHQVVLLAVSSRKNGIPMVEQGTKAKILTGYKTRRQK